jgi:Bacteriophage holin family
MKEWTQSVALAAVAALAPIQAVLISVGVLIVADLFTGMLAAHKRGEKLASAAMRRTVSKLLIYQTAVITGFLLETYLLSSLVPVSKIVAGAIGLVEFKSILENCNAALGQDIFQTVLLKLGSDNDPRNKDKTPNKE